MRCRGLFFFSILLTLITPAAFAQSSAQSSGTDWQQQLAKAMPLLGHRNWILVVDSAYPLENSAGIETIETNADQLAVVQAVLKTVNASIHVRPDVYMDAELPFVPDQDAPGASAYRAHIKELLKGYEIHSVPHEKALAQIDEAGKTFHVLVLKTTMAIPYTSVFIRLDCKYWPAEAEKRMRAQMGPTQ